MLRSCLLLALMTLTVVAAPVPSSQLTPPRPFCSTSTVERVPGGLITVKVDLSALQPQVVKLAWWDGAFRGAVAGVLAAGVLAILLWPRERN
jgi:hypothetical protein